MLTSSLPSPPWQPPPPNEETAPNKPLAVPLQCSHPHPGLCQVGEIIGIVYPSLPTLPNTTHRHLLCSPLTPPFSCAKWDAHVWSPEPICRPMWHPSLQTWALCLPAPWQGGEELFLSPKHADAHHWFLMPPSHIVGDGTGEVPNLLYWSLFLWISMAAENTGEHIKETEIHLRRWNGVKISPLRLKSLSFFTRMSNYILTFSHHVTEYHNTWAIMFFSSPELIALASKSFSLECVVGMSALALLRNDETFNVCRGMQGILKCWNWQRTACRLMSVSMRKWFGCFPEREITENG